VDKVDWGVVAEGLKEASLGDLSELQIVAVGAAVAVAVQVGILEVAYLQVLMVLHRVVVEKGHVAVAFQ
jgi:hypothetical protein